MNYVIIGNSAAAVGTIAGIREIDSTGKITVISDEKYHTYSRPLISYWLEGKVSDKNIYYRPADFYEKNNVETILGKKAMKIDAERKCVVLEDGLSVPYDKLMVATGSKPFVPPMKGLEKVNYHTFMTYDSAKAIRSEVKKGMKVLIIGAGLIGLKAAEALAAYETEITVIDLADRILPSILDVSAGMKMQRHIENHGVKFILKTSVEEFSEHSAKLQNGMTVDFDMLIVAVGVRPNTELVADAGGKVERGIITDMTQKTSLDDIYSAGDCTVSYDAAAETNRILAILPNAYLQGEVAGRNMAGRENYYLNAIPQNAIGLFGLHIISAGDYNGEEYVTETENTYKKLIFRDNKLKGYILLGDVARAGIYTGIIKEGLDLSEVDENLLKEKPQMMMFSKERREEKLGGILR